MRSASLLTRSQGHFPVVRPSGYQCRCRVARLLVIGCCLHRSLACLLWFSIEARFVVRAAALSVRLVSLRRRAFLCLLWLSQRCKASTALATTPSYVHRWAPMARGTAHYFTLHLPNPNLSCIQKTV